MSTRHRDTLRTNLQWAMRYIVAVLLTLLLFAGLNQLAMGDLEVQCAKAGGHQVQHVRNFLCADSHGRIIPLD